MSHPTWKLAANTVRVSSRFFATSTPLKVPNQSDNADGPTVLLTRPLKHVAAIELNKPKAKNAFGLDTAKELINVLEQLDSDCSVRCVILNGRGADFTSGVDLKSFFSVHAKLLETEDVATRAKLLRNVIEQFQAPFKRLHSFSKPIVCVMHGASIGLGMELAAFCDIRYCSRDARMAIREVLIGIAADVGSLQVMPRVISNQSLLKELIYTGRYMTVEEAFNLGFVSKICDTKELALNSALETAEIISRRSPVAVQGSKVNLRFSQDKPIDVGLDYNAIWNMAMMQSGDVAKAIGGILSKNDAVDFDNF